MAVFFTCHAHALGNPRAGGDAHQSKPFGKLGLSLSLTLSPTLSKPTPPVMASEVPAKAKTLSELNAEIAAMEALIQAQQRQLGLIPASPPTTSTDARTRPPINPTAQAEAVATSGNAVVAAVPASDSIPGVAPAISRESGVQTGQEVIKEKPTAKIAVPAAASVSKETGSLIGLPGMDWAIGLAVLLLSALGFVLYSRSKERTGKRVSEDSGLFGASGTDEEVGADLPAETAMPTSPADGAMKVPAKAESQAKPLSILPPEYEMLEEADIYLRFGHDKLAEEALREAIKINPKNPQAYLTLSRIYFSREDKAAFLDAARQLKELGEASIWSRVAEMGRNLDADNPLYRDQD